MTKNGNENDEIWNEINGAIKINFLLSDPYI